RGVSRRLCGPHPASRDRRHRFGGGAQALLAAPDGWRKFIVIQLGPRGSSSDGRDVPAHLATRNPQITHGGRAAADRDHVSTGLAAAASRLNWGVRGSVVDRARSVLFARRLGPRGTKAHAALSTTFSQPSSFLWKSSKPRAASESGRRWVITKLGSISPRSMRSSSGAR